MGLSMKIRVKGINRLEKKFKNIQKKAINSKPFNEYLAKEAFAQVIKNFVNESGPRGRWKSIKHRSGKILRDTGRLFNSIKWKVITHGAKIYSNVNYAIYHQFGGKHLPKRSFLWVPKKFIKKIKKAFLKYFLKDFR